MADSQTAPSGITRTHGFDVFNRNCPSRTVLDEVGGRWALLTLSSLTAGTCRFSQLRRKVDGVSDKMLAQVLLNLERDGLVVRDEKSRQVVEYSLTPTGISLGDAAGIFLETLMVTMASIQEARLDYQGGMPTDSSLDSPSSSQ